MKRRRRNLTPGLPPGSLPHRSDTATRPPQLEIVEYSADGVRRAQVDQIPGDAAAPPPGTVRWLRISGVPDRTTLDALGATFGIHPIVLEDVASTTQRIKTERYEGYTYTVLRVLGRTPDGAATDVEMDLLLVNQVLISVDEGDSPELFQPIFNRLANEKSLLRRAGADLLYYAVVDLAVDCFFPLVEEYQQLVEDLEDSIVIGPRPEHIDAIHRLRAEVRDVRSTLWATRDMTADIERTGVPGMTEQTRFYFRDAHDHVFHLLDSVTDLRDSANSLQELHMSGMSNRMNEIMKVLTVISTIFIPITFIAGIYGMNFVHMPELQFPWAYPAVLGLMIAIGAAKLVFFKRRKWF